MLPWFAQVYGKMVEDSCCVAATRRLLCAVLVAPISQ